MAGGCDVLVSGGLVLGALVSGGLLTSGVVLTGGCDVLLSGGLVLLLGLFTSLCGMLLPALLQSDEIIFTSVTAIEFELELEDEGVVLLAVPAVLAEPLVVPVTSMTCPTWSDSFELSPVSEYVVPEVLSVRVKLPFEPLRQPWIVWLLPVVVCEVLVVVVVVVWLGLVDGVWATATDTASSRIDVRSTTFLMQFLRRFFLPVGVQLPLPNLGGVLLQPS